MRVLLWIVLLAAGLWGGFWWIESQAMQRNTERWFAAQSARGLVAENTGIAVRGFPNRVDLTISDIALADPQSGFGWNAPFVQVFSMTWKPWHLIAAFANQQVITTPREKITINSQGMRGSLHLLPRANLGLHEIVLEGSALELRSTLGWAMGADRLVIAALEDTELPNTYRIGLSVLGFQPDAKVMLTLAEQPDLPGTIEDIHLDTNATFSAPIDQGLGQKKQVLTGLDIKEARLLWGGLRIFAHGNLTVTPDGLAEGVLALRIEGWRNLPPVLAVAGPVTPRVTVAMARAMEILAKGGPDPETLEVPLRMTSGRMFLGPIPLGLAPRLR